MDILYAFLVLPPVDIYTVFLALHCERCAWNYLMSELHVPLSFLVIRFVLFLFKLPSALAGTSHLPISDEMRWRINK